MVQWLRGREVYGLIGNAAGAGIIPPSPARGRWRLDFLSALSCRTTSAADAKTSGGSWHCFLSRRWHRISKLSIKHVILGMNNNYLVVNIGIQKKKLYLKCNANSAALHVCNYPDPWVIITKCRTWMSPPAMAKVSQQWEMTLSTSRGRHWRCYWYKWKSKYMHF